MKLIMTLVTKNEDDILAHMLEYHYTQGVDFFIVVDHNSTDYTPNILRQYQDRGKLKVIPCADECFYQAQWVTKMAREAATVYGADWIINTDSDEFWVPDSGTINIKDALSKVPPEYGRLHINRYDFLFRGYTQGPFYQAMTIRENVRKWTKCCHKADPDVEVHEGNHDINSKLSCYSESIPLRILHYPVRSYIRYKKAVEDKASAFFKRTDIEPGTNFHWEGALEHIKNGTFDAHFQQFCLASDQINYGITRGQYIVDDSIAKFFYILKNGKDIL